MITLLACGCLGEHIALPRKQPSRRYVVIPDKVHEPSQLHAILRRLVFFESIQIPTIYSISIGKSLFAPYHSSLFQGIQSLEKSFGYFFVFFRLHILSEWPCAALNFAFISSSRSCSSLCHFSSCSGLKSGFRAPFTVCS